MLSDRRGTLHRALMARMSARSMAEESSPAASESPDADELATDGLVPAVAVRAWWEASSLTGLSTWSHRGNLAESSEVGTLRIQARAAHNARVNKAKMRLAGEGEGGF